MLLHPDGYAGKKIMVVGGGNSAIEAANMLAERGAEVTMSYRQENFFRITAQNRQEIQKNIDSNRIKTYFNSGVTAIADNALTLGPERHPKLFRQMKSLFLSAPNHPKSCLHNLASPLRMPGSWPEWERWQR